MPGLRVHVIPAAAISADQGGRWNRFVAASPYPTPMLAAEVFRAIGQRLPDVKIAVIEEDGREIGYLPFRATLRGRIAAPIPMCDYQALIGPPEFNRQLEQILAQSGIAVWEFDHWLARDGETWCRHGVIKPTNASLIDLGQGHDAYLAGQAVAGTSFGELRNKRRLLARDHGPLRFELDCRDIRLLGPLFDWKARRFQNGTPVASWIGEVLTDLAVVKGTTARGLVSVLYAGDRPVAINYNLAGFGRVHYWHVAYDPAFGRYSPGGLLIQDLAQNLARIDCHALDLGPGGEAYKAYFANATVPGLSGAIERPGLLTLARRLGRFASDGVRSNVRLRGLARQVRAWRRGAA